MTKRLRCSFFTRILIKVCFVNTFTADDEYTRSFSVTTRKKVVAISVPATFHITELIDQSFLSIFSCSTYGIIYIVTFWLHWLQIRWEDSTNKVSWRVYSPSALVMKRFILCDNDETFPYQTEWIRNTSTTVFSEAFRSWTFFAK